jgi:hypothetical protein
MPVSAARSGGAPDSRVVQRTLVVASRVLPQQDAPTLHHQHLRHLRAGWRLAALARLAASTSGRRDAPLVPLHELGDLRDAAGRRLQPRGRRGPLLRAEGRGAGGRDGGGGQAEPAQPSGGAPHHLPSEDRQPCAPARLPLRGYVGTDVRVRVIPGRGIRGMSGESFFTNKYFLREGPSPRGAPSVPPFCISFFPKKRLELKSLKGRTKAEEEGTRYPVLLSIRPSLKAL